MDILVTGASGNVGSEIVNLLLSHGHNVFAGTRSGSYGQNDNVIPTVVDFEQGIKPERTFDAIFLMRPPQLTDPDIFERFLQPYARSTRIVFLSVMGADTKSYLPHAKIEKKIAEMGFEHVFIRPTYFMENLLTTLWPELDANNRVYLPSGKLILNWVSVRDVASVSVAALTGQISDRGVLVNAGVYAGFSDVCSTINEIAGTSITYEPARLFGYIRYMRKQGNDWPFIAVMLLLHFLPRLGPAAKPLPASPKLPAHEFETLEDFVRRNEDRFRQLR
ncbi:MULTISPECIES: NmrA family NAD(P)-binding protein [Halocynthiibacter]|uniref:NAD-dependent epimerase/dehydratase family protein n=1 Tax=Halocynthiibacter halioticoli TaxID=2986804 RepID=A0AAE3IZ07_9RHOB|nr:MULTISPECIES: NmrA family NAD(P)-binding protein [Halocynthiibacter]MCV6823523.1 NAD-dependent epimerase/dehydratase family protein [Halocynthiibacter halioticoli]MCW4056524.1 NAD-dependent epimerase/dehydratase family protein [Halocynthiibacter sp. SDUM655004]